MTQESRVTGIWLKPAHKAKMQTVDLATMITMKGLEGNINQGGKRQVTIIEAEIWRWLMLEMGSDLPPETRRANVMLENFSLYESTGKILQISDCQIQIIGETKPCKQMEKALPGLEKLMKTGWRGGAYGVILHGGIVEINDPVLCHEIIE